VREIVISSSAVSPKDSPVSRGARIFQLNWVFDEFFVTDDVVTN